MWESNSYQAHEDHKQLYEALEKSMARDHTDQLLTDLTELPPPPPPVGPSRTSGTFGASGSSQVTHPPPPLSTNQSDQSQSTTAPSSSKTAASAEYMAWMTTDTRLKPCVSSIPEELHMDDDTTPNEQPLTEDRTATPEPAWSIPSSDLPVPVNNWASALVSTYAPPLENSLLAQTGDMAIFIDWFCKKQGITKLKQQDLEGPAYEISQIQVIREPDSGKFQGKGRTSTPTESSGHDESSSLYAELRLIVSETESDEEVPGIVARVQDEGQAGPNPGEHDEGQAGPNPGDAAASQPPSSHVVHAGPNIEHMDLEASDTSIQPNPEEIDEEFTIIAYPNVQENLKLPTEGEVRLEEPASSAGTLSSPQNVDKELSFTSQFLAEKSQKDKPKKTNIEAERIGDLEQHMADLVQANLALEERMDKHGSRLYKLENLDIPHQVSKAVDEIVTDVVDWAIQPPLRDRFRYFPEADMKEILHHRMWESYSYKAHEDHKKLYEALEYDQSTSTAAPSSSKTAASAEYTAWTTTDTRLKPSALSIPEDLHMDDDTAPNEQVHSSGDVDIGHDHIPTHQMEECHKLLTDQVDESLIRYNVSKPLPLGGPPGQVTIQSDFFFNKDLEYLRYGRKSGRLALSISKMKAAYYPDVGLEQMVPDQMWIKEECKYDIAAMYGISHWWFQRQRFYIGRHTSKGDRRAVRTHMRILSVIRIEVFSLYGYDYMKKIILRHLNHLPPEHKKILTTAVNLWTRNLVIRQRVEDFQLGIKSYQTQLNLTKPRWDATGFEFKHDFTVIDSPKAVTFRDKYEVQMIMQFNEIHKFSEGTLQHIDEALDYRVKEFKVNRMNPGLNTRFWTRKDVDRSKEFMFSIQKWLKDKENFRNWKAFLVEKLERGGLQDAEENRMITSSRQSRSISCGNMSDTKVNHNNDRSPSRAKSKQSSGSCHV
ncbi:hypothetical protein Tco_1294448 [Tanacetum coccineum]